jgi:predicted ATP-dependent protease
VSFNSHIRPTESLDTIASSDNNESLSPEKLEMKKNRRYNKMSELVMKQAKKIKTKDEFKYDLSFILFVCNIVETRILKKDNINKKELVIDTLKNLFAYNEEEHKVLERNIEFLHSNNLIKKDAIIKQMQSYWGKQKG